MPKSRFANSFALALIFVAIFLATNFVQRKKQPALTKQINALEFREFAPTNRIGMGNIKDVALSPDDQIIAVSTSTGVWLYDFNTLERLRMLSGYKAGAASLAWSPDGQYLAVSDYEIIQILDVETWQIWREFAGGAISLSWSPDSQRLAFVDRNFHVQILEIDGDRLPSTMEMQAKKLRRITWSPDGKHLAASDLEEHKIHILNASGGAIIRTLIGHTQKIQALVWSPNGKLLASGANDKSIRVWDITSQENPVKFWHGDAVTALAWSPDGETLASGMDNGEFWIWDIPSKKRLKRFFGFYRWPTNQAIKDLAWSNDGHQIISSANDNIVRKWDASNGQELGSMQDHAGYLSSLAWSPTNDTLLIGGDKSGALQVWQLGEWPGELQTFAGHTKGIAAIAWSPDGARAASGSYDGSIQIWDTSDWATSQIQSPFSEDNPVVSMAWSPNGDHLAVGTGDSFVYILDTFNWKISQQLESKIGWIKVLEWSPDSSLIAGGGRQKTLHVWNVRQPEILHTLGISDFHLFEDPPVDLSGVRIYHIPHDVGNLTGNIGRYSLGNWDIWRWFTAAAEIPFPRSMVKLAQSPNSRYFVGYDSLVGLWVWDQQLETYVQTTEYQRCEPREAAWSPDGSRFAINCEDYINGNAVVIWSAAPPGSP